MQSLLTILCALGVFGANLRADQSSATPNVLIVIADDQGYGEFGFTGNKVVQTPNLDALAAQSAVFKNFVVAPACSPTRSSFLTGRNHLSVGVWGVGNRGYTLRDETLMPRFFQAAGYGTCYFGKPDSVRMLELMPWDRGCDDAFTGNGGYIHRDPTIVHKSGQDEMKGWTCDLNVDQALIFIRAQGEKPWWATVAFIVPHLPWICDGKFSAPYRRQGCSQKLADYYGCCSQMDAAIGRLLAGLRAAGRERDTIVVFFSDNGPSYKESSSADIASRNVAQLKGGKASAWDNGIREPLLVRWPDKIAPGGRKQFGSVEDILPTLIDLAGLPAKTSPKHRPFDGISLRPALENPAASDVERTVFRIAIAGDGSPRDPARTGVISDPRQMRLEDHHVTLRGNRFKYHALPGGKSALFDLAADPGETNDVGAVYPDVAAGLANQCRTQWEAILNSGRAFRMPAVVVSKTPGPGINTIAAGLAQKVRGHVRNTADGIRGFAAADDAVEYAIEVHEAGKFKVAALGTNMAQCAELSLAIGEVHLAGRRKPAGGVEFGPVDLKAGPTSVVLAVAGKPATHAQPAIIGKIGFYPVPARTEKPAP